MKIFNFFKKGGSNIKKATENIKAANDTMQKALILLVERDNERIRLKEKS